MDLISGLGGSCWFGEKVLQRGDSTRSVVDLKSVFGTGLNFYGTTYTHLSINNDGNVTFGKDGLDAGTPWKMSENSGVPIIAPFWGNVNTHSYTLNQEPNVVSPTPGGTSKGSNSVWYDIDTSGFGKLTITWDDVGYSGPYGDGLSAKKNAFQMQIIGIGGGYFYVKFIYEDINWIAGSSMDGLSGTVARAGFSAGDGLNNHLLKQVGFEIAD